MKEKDLVKDLMTKAIQANTSANVLLKTGDTDGACNRAYYAMYDAARVALVVTGHANEIGRTHKGVLNAFSEHLVKNGPLPKEMGRFLKHAETYRYVADYEGNQVQPNAAQEIVGQAGVFVATIAREFKLTRLQQLITRRSKSNDLER